MNQINGLEDYLPYNDTTQSNIKLDEYSNAYHDPQKRIAS